MTSPGDDATADLMFDFAMPSLGADMDEGQIVEWQVAVGDTVHRGDIVARVETEKSDIDIEIWRDGEIVEMLVDVNKTVTVGTPIMRVRATTADRPDHQQEQRHEPAPPITPVSATPVAPPPVAESLVARPPVAPTSGVLASPLARRMAQARDIDLVSVAGTGPGGAVRGRDVETYSAPAADTVAPDRTLDRAARMRAMIADRMSRANREIPHYYLERDVDLGPLTVWLAQENDARPIEQRILPAAAFVKATALAAAHHGELNGHWIDDQFRSSADVNVSVAISLRGGGLVTPYLEHADGCSLEVTMAKLQEFTTAARGGTLRSEWTGGASSITVTNLGERGADLVHGVISPPEVALVGFGRIVDRPWVVDGQVVVRPIVTVTLAADHRATDGAVGSRFLATLAKMLEHPEEL
jgi:pyruvate dehydrogenase E2 component (dihydrolipoamide acetyltransferase)